MTQRIRTRIGGTAVITSVGTFGKDSAWGIPITDDSLELFLAVITEKAAAVEGRIAVRQYTRRSRIVIAVCQKAVSL